MPIDQLDPITEPQRDVKGRYLIPDPVTGKQRAWSRATTVAGAIDDRFNIERWLQRCQAIGFARRSDLVALAGAYAEDKAKLNDICTQAQIDGGSQYGANLGTALHALTEAYDRKENAIIVAEDLVPIFEAYCSTMAASGLRIATLPDGRLAREVVLLCPELEIAGTADHIFATPHGYTIGDLKSGKLAVKHPHSIAVQLAIYAHSTHIWDPATATLSEAPAFNRTNAIVIHLPVDAARCELYDIDLEAGWEAAKLACKVRKWRSRKGLIQTRSTCGLTPAGDDPFAGLEPAGTVTAPLEPRAPIREPGTLPEPVAAAAPADTEPEGEPVFVPNALALRAWLLERLGQLRAAGHGAFVADNWPADVPGLKSAHVHTLAELMTLERLVGTVESSTDMPFVPAPEGAVPPGRVTPKPNQSAAYKRGVARAKKDMKAQQTKEDATQ